VGCVNGNRPHAATQPAVHSEVAREFWPDGQFRVEREVVRKPDGTLVNHGAYVSWFLSGKKEYEASYLDGQIDGVERQWHDNGQLRSEQHYAHGLRHGPRYDWDSQGRLRKEEHYTDDLPDGQWTIWEDDGRIKWQGAFERGKPVR
jgi:antitoxin component YwqK of YwqJK toxin-antitoxin module